MDHALIFIPKEIVGKEGYLIGFNPTGLMATVLLVDTKSSKFL